MSYGLLLRKKGAGLTTMQYYSDAKVARIVFDNLAASKEYELLELIEFKRLARWEDHG